MKEKRFTMFNGLRMRYYILYLFLAATLMIGGKSLQAQSLQFNQLNFNYDGTVTTNSDWGAVDLTFTGSTGLLYLNLTVNGEYVIENMPVQTHGDVGADQTQRFWFPIGPAGIPVPLVSYGFTLTTEPAVMPPVTGTAPVAADWVIIMSGSISGTGGGDNHPPAATKQVGGVPVQPAQSHKNFPNQEAGVNECVPAGISNSLQFLNTKFGLKMKAADIGIPSLKNGTGWGPNGCPRPGWVDNKKNYVKNKKLPITTRKLNGPSNIRNIGAEIAAGQDVEMDIKWKGTGAHCVAVTGWVDLGNGRYKITITHDKKQGAAGGTVSESAIYNKNTGKWEGALVNGTNDFFFVVECPRVSIGQQAMPTTTPTGGYSDKTNGGASFDNGKYEIKNVRITGLPAGLPLPAGGATVTQNFPGTIEYRFSADSGNTFIESSAPVMMSQTTTHLVDEDGASEFATEISQLLSVGTVMIRESPTKASSGSMRVANLQGMFRIGSFFDIFYDISIDGGATWMPSSSSSSLLEMNSTTPAIRQLNFDYQGTLTPWSDWGALDLTFPGSPDLQYLNLTVNGVWVIQNMPMKSLERSSTLQTQRFWFPIGPRGMMVELVEYGFSLTPTIAGMPDMLGHILVDQDDVIIHSGDLAYFGTGDNHPPLATIQVGGQVVQAGFKHIGFPNQEAGVNECVPVGISNSLKFLNTKHGLGMPAADIGIPSLKNGTGWGPNGCPRPGWVENKKDYVRTKKLPITTRKLPGPANIQNIGAEIAAGQDVEMDIKWKGPGAHCVSVTEWTDLGNGKYKITITHDSKQGQAGGTVSESATYDSNTGTWDGALANGTNDFFFVVECPVTTINQQLPTIPTGTSARFKPHSGSYYNGGMQQIQNLALFNYGNYITPPPPGGTEIFTYQCMASLDFSLDHGMIFTPWMGQAIVVQRVTTLEVGTDNRTWFETELLSMDLMGPPLPEGFSIRESPTLPSLGQTTLKPLGSGLFHADSFFDIFTEISPDGGITWLQPDAPDTPGSSLLEMEGPAIPATRELQNILWGDGDISCFDATQTIRVAGDGTFVTVENGGAMFLVAGQQILFFPDTKVLPGGYLSARISLDGDYCSNMQFSPVTVAGNGEEKEPQPANAVANALFRVYPNPTTGDFTLEFNGSGVQPASRLEIFGMHGERVLDKTLPASRTHAVSLTGMPKGIYLVKVMTEGSEGTVRIVKQ